MNNVFDSSFVALVTEVLTAKCVGSECVTRTEVTEILGMPKKEWLISALLEENLLPDFEIRLGRHGGIARKGAEFVKKEATLDPEFVTLLNETLAKYVPSRDKGTTTRGVIAAKMGMPGSDTEAKISLAMKQSLCPGFASARAVGIFRTSEAPLLEVGEETPKPRKRNKKAKVDAQTLETV